MAESTNAEQIEYWRDDAGPKWVRAVKAMDPRIRHLGERALQKLAPQPGERVLDIGCGCGDTTEALASQVGSSGRVLGVDVSTPMLEVARQRVKHLDQAKLVEADAQVWRSESPYDAVFSRFGVMFFQDPQSAFANLRASIKPTGRLTFVCWREREFNPWMGEPIGAVAHMLELPDPPAPRAPGPFAFGEADYLRSVLAEGGWRDIELERFDAPITLGSTPEQAARFYLDLGPLSSVAESLSNVKKAEIQSVLENYLAHDSADSVRLPASVWIASANP